MKLLFTALALSAVVLAASAKSKKKGDAESAGEVLQLTDNNFDDAIQEHESADIVRILTSPQVQPEFEKAAKVLKADGLHIAQVDATASEALARKYDIQGFPTLKFFKKGASAPGDYNGGRDAESIVQWVRRKSGPAAVTIKSKEQLDSIRETADVVFVAFVEDADSDLATVFKGVADTVEDATFAIVAGSAAETADIRESCSVTSAQAIVALNNFEGEENVVAATGEEVTQFAGDASALSTWVRGNSLPLVVVFSQETAPKIFRGDLKTHFLLFVDSDSGDSAQDEALAQFRTAAGQHKDSGILFVQVPSSEDRVLGYFGITSDQIPTAVLVNMVDGGMKKYKWNTAALTADAFSQFVNDYKDGKLSPFLKSDPAPDAAENEAAAVKVVTGNTFKELVIDNDKDVLLEVYAPWCGHCKKLAPLYEALGRAAQEKVSTLVIAKMDGTTNEVDHPGVNVRGFPTILFFPAGKKASAVDFEGNRDVEGFLSFLSKTATHPVKITAEDVDAPEEE